eukprot:CAMPEP_0201897704 /NCGR_PEP_ID=MMETSP0902-20130614/47087_1 /ASSEMBLY_ACC=CAM_ASM_000551 /TAXON_ID=420261 /ORGANISM="Thalassiosira antarctica, Strain CCMP982" /LENGTH=358 /DNA_ID=CAMNT_0048430635 /DNA_START=679 /DNA_END=1755 /DNA_ORIENTATION=-
MKVILHLSFLWTCAHALASETNVLHSVPSSRNISLAFVAPSARLATRKDATCPKIMPSTLLSSTTANQPDTAKFNNLIYATDDTVQLLRNELKSRLLKAADDFKNMKSQEDAITGEAQEVEVNVDEQDNDRGYVIRLLHKIVLKISRTFKASGQKKPTESRGILTSDSFRQMQLEVGAAGNRVIELAEQLSLLNPTLINTLGFKHYGGAPPTESKLAGNWKLRFTTGADASFPNSQKRGVATTSQVVDAKDGTFTNIVDFERGNLKGFRVVVEGEPTSATDIGLTFKAVTILRKSRFPRLFGQFTIRLPSRLIRWLASWNIVGEEKNKGPYLQLRYLDDYLRMHITDSGNWFIQTRLA